MNTNKTKQSSSSSGHPSGTTDKSTSDKKSNSDSTKKTLQSSTSSFKKAKYKGVITDGPLKGVTIDENNTSLVPQYKAFTKGLSASSLN